MSGLLHRVSSVRLPHNGSIVACGDIVRLHDLRRVKEFFPLDLPVAENAGVRGDPAEIILDERINDLLLKRRNTVQGVIGDVQLPGRFSRVVDLTAAALLSILRHPGPEGNAAYLIAGLLKQVRRYCAVHSPGQSCQYLQLTLPSGRSFPSFSRSPAGRTGSPPPPARSSASCKPAGRPAPPPPPCWSASWRPPPASP